MTESVHPLRTAITHRCPRCGIGAIYKLLLTIRDECPQCGLSYSAHDVGDGPAFFTITLLGFVVVGFALWLELVHHLPYWQNFALSGLMLLLLTPFCLRFFKSYLIAMKYKLHRLDEEQ